MRFRRYLKYLMTGGLSMRALIVRQLDYDLTPVARLALVGHMLEAMRPALAHIDTALPLKGGVANSDIVRSYLGLLTQGKSDFDAVENFRGDAFFKQGMHLRAREVVEFDVHGQNVGVRFGQLAAGAWSSCGNCASL